VEGIGDQAHNQGPRNNQAPIAFSSALPGKYYWYDSLSKTLHLSVPDFCNAVKKLDYQDYLMPLPPASFP